MHSIRIPSELGATPLAQPAARRCLLPCASRQPGLQPATNPHECELAGLRLLGSSGQNLDDLAKYCAVSDRRAWGG
jgi:DNA polymerase delta subunit 2